VCQLCIDFKKAYDSVWREVLYIVTEFGITMKLVRFIKMCLNETYNKVRIAKYLSVAGESPVAACEHSKELLGSLKEEKFLD